MLKQVYSDFKSDLGSSEIIHSANFHYLGVLESIVSTLRATYPRLNINYVPGINSAWVVVHCSEMVISSPIYPPTYDPFLVLTLENGNVTYDFRTSVQSIDKGLFSWIKIKAQLDSLLPYSGFELCPGLKAYPAAVRFESKHYVHITTPYDRHQSDACSVWHIPKNRQQVYGGPLLNMCEPCKVLYNQLETIRKRHENYSPGKRKLGSYLHVNGH